MNRRTLTSILLLLMVGVAATAQDTQLAQIRKAYAEAKQRTEEARMLQAQGEPGNEMVIDNYYQMPACGPSKETVKFYYKGGYEEEEMRVVYTPYFINRKFNVAANEFYQEFLFDQKGTLIFFYEKSLTTDIGDKAEARYYWGANGFFHKVVKGEAFTEETFAQRLASDLTEAFDKLMNRDY